MSRIGLLSRDVRCPCGATLKDSNDYEFGTTKNQGWVKERIMSTCVVGHVVGILYQPGRLVVDVLGAAPEKP